MFRVHCKHYNYSISYVCLISILQTNRGKKVKSKKKKINLICNHIHHRSQCINFRHIFETTISQLCWLELLINDFVFCSVFGNKGFSNMLFIYYFSVLKSWAVPCALCIHRKHEFFFFSVIQYLCVLSKWGDVCLLNGKWYSME